MNGFSFDFKFLKYFFTSKEIPWVIMIVCTLLFILPDKALKMLSIKDFLSEHPYTPGISMLIAIAIVMLQYIKSYSTKKNLKTLPGNEKEYLYRLLKNDRQSFEASSFSSLARSLEEKGIIKETYSGSNDVSSYLVEHFVWRHLKKNENRILKVINYKPSDETQKKLHSMRHIRKSWREL